MDPPAFLKAVNVADQPANLDYLAANDPTTAKDENGLTALHIATMNNTKHIVQLMVEHEAGCRPGTVREWVNARTNDGRTCLHIAARQGYLVSTRQNLSELLVSLGADPQIRTDEGSSPIHYAALGNQPALIAYFYEEVGLSAALCDYTGNTPLHYAAMEGAELALSLLLMLAKDQIDVGNAKGNRPLHIAAAGGQKRATKLLMTQGADITVMVILPSEFRLTNPTRVSPAILPRKHRNNPRAASHPQSLFLIRRAGAASLRIPSVAFPVSIVLRLLGGRPVVVLGAVRPAAVHLHGAVHGRPWEGTAGH